MGSAKAIHSGRRKVAPAKGMQHEIEICRREAPAAVQRARAAGPAVGGPRRLVPVRVGRIVQADDARVGVGAVVGLVDAVGHVDAVVAEGDAVPAALARWKLGRRAGALFELDPAALAEGLVVQGDVLQLERRVDARARQEETGARAAEARVPRLGGHPAVEPVLDARDGEALPLAVVGRRARHGHLHCNRCNRQSHPEENPATGRLGSFAKHRSWHRGSRGSCVEESWLRDQLQYPLPLGSIE